MWSILYILYITNYITEKQTKLSATAESRTLAH